MRFLRPADGPLVHIVGNESLRSLCRIIENWVYPQTPFGLEYICDICKAEWAILQMAGHTVHLYNWYDSTTNTAYIAREGFNGLLY